MNSITQRIGNDILRPIIDAVTTPEGTNPFLVGPHGASLAFVTSLLIKMGQETHPQNTKNTFNPRGPFPESLIILTPSQSEAEFLYQDLQFFHDLLNLSADSISFFPDRGQGPYEITSPSVDLIAQRMRTLFRLLNRHPTIVITTPEAMLHRLVPHSVFLHSCLTLKTQSVLAREPLITQLLQIGYRRVSVVEIPGEFSIRGGIVDVFSTSEDAPFRIEFIGDTVESTRLFDPVSQESSESISHVDILPAREYLILHDFLNGSLPTISPDAEWRSAEIYASMETLFDYFIEKPLVLLDRPTSLAGAAQEFWDRILEAWDQLDHAQEEVSYSDPYQLFSTWDDLLNSSAQCPRLATDITPPAESEWQPLVNFPVQSPISVGLGLRGKTFTDTLSTLEHLRNQGPVNIIVRSSGQVSRLLVLFNENQAPVAGSKFSSMSSDSYERQPFYIQQGFLSKGFLVQSPPFAIVTAEDLFAKVARPRQQPKRINAAFLSSLDDLSIGDYVVHIQHGISRYKGLRRLSVQDFESDYMILEFASRDTLYVPLDRLNQVQKYRGGDPRHPKLDRLGGTSWSKTKARVKKGIEEMTHELVELYASREIASRRIYYEDKMLAHEFEAAFDYEETPDQLRAIEDIHRDLELAKPMDRLICGDVGYGKTEVAMRAAFKAVQDNRQAAVLVPTTLLAQQHYETFSRRFSPFPVRVETLSRFQSLTEAKEILADLSSGVIDIIIGTHRLLQKNVQFKNLGLVIIDEEQWFGVRHKEYLKQLRTQVDVLTLTATPIPRTLQMAFSGIRDLSVIDTPPSNRLAIRTQVLRFNPTIIREAIRREMARGGQIFYVHNRVQTIERTATWIQELVPEASVLMAHGQMNARLLESVMLQFFHGKANILLSSAIIQSGLDLPNANTILVDRADTFGLAQLYQLRGRVGRAGDQAYAYFFFPNEEVLSTDAQKRLMAIQDFAELGSGFRIATADLEIRGAGNLLGKQQSGNIAAIGLDLYMQMIEQAAQQLKGQEIEEELDPTLHLPVSAYIPDDYVEDSHQRLSLYKRLSTIQNISSLALLHEETQDRFGHLPQPVERLFEVMQIKLLAKKLGLLTLEVSLGTITLTFDPKVTVPKESFDWIMQYGGANLELLSPRSFSFRALNNDWPSIFGDVTAILEGMLNSSPDTMLVTSTS